MSLEDAIGPSGARYVRDVAARVGTIVGPDLAGVWLVGSASLGDYDPARSDLDVQAVSDEPLPAQRRLELAAALAHDALPSPARGLEFVLYAHGDLRDPEGPAFSLNLNTGARMDEHVALDPRDDPRFWFVVDVAIARDNGLVLAGRRAREVLPVLPRAMVVRALAEGLEWYASRGGAPAEAVLGACRTLAWLYDGRWRSKGDSAAWALCHLADPVAARKALALREDPAAPALTPAETAGVVGAARAALGAASV